MVYLSSDVASFALLYVEENCEAVLTCNFTNRITTIQSDKGIIVLNKDGVIMYTYTLLDQILDESGVSTAPEFVTELSTSLQVTLMNFDIVNEGYWTCGVVESTKFNTESNAVTVDISDASRCTSKLDPKSLIRMLMSSNIRCVQVALSHFFSTDVAVLITAYNDSECEVTLTCSFTRTLVQIQANNGSVTFSIGTDTVVTYDKSGDLSVVSNGVSVGVAAVGSDGRSLELRHTTIAVSSEGLATCGVTGSSFYDVQSRSISVQATKTSCESRCLKC